MTSTPRTLWTSPDGHNIADWKLTEDRIISITTMANKTYAVDLPREGAWFGGRKVLTRSEE